MSDIFSLESETYVLSGFLKYPRKFFEHSRVSEECFFHETHRTVYSVLRQFHDGKKEIAGYASIDWLFNYELDTGLIFNLSVTNLLDKEYVRYSNAAGHDEDSSLENLAEPGRSFAFNVNYSF